MCYHLVTYVRYDCGHQYPTKRHYIDCNSVKCRRSKHHKQTPHDCTTECKDIMLSDQSLVMEEMQEFCYACRGVPPPAYHGTERPYDTDSE